MTTVPTCETAGCLHPATHCYGPSCCGDETGLMYLCLGHADGIRMWRTANLDEAFACTQHPGRRLTVRKDLILERLP